MLCVGMTLGGSASELAAEPQGEYPGGAWAPLITLKPLVQRLQSWEAHLMHGDTHRLRRKLFDAYSFRLKEDRDQDKGRKHDGQP